MKPIKFEKLKKLGEPVYDKWIDYVSMGFEIKDIKALLEIVKGASLLNCEDNFDEGYESVHAWRALGQLACDSIVQPLLTMLNDFSISDNDWATEELPVVFGLIGKKAIKPLREFVQIKTNEEFARVSASDGLYEIYKHDSSLKKEVIDAYNIYLQEPDTNAFSLNGLVVSNIMDMQASELIKPIAQLFANNIIDNSICGDYHEVEHELGVQFALSQSKAIERPTAEHYFETINKYLIKYTSDYAISEMTNLDGYLTATLCADEIPAYQWSMDIWGGLKHLPEWESFEEYKEFNNSVFEYSQQIKQLLVNDEYQPLIAEDPNGITYPRIWCIGFIDASQHWKKDTEEFSVPAMLGLGMIAILADENPKEKLKDLDLDLQQMEDRLSESVYNIYHELQGDAIADFEDDIDMLDYNGFSSNDEEYNYQNSQPFVREEKKVGRNEPCPCGSGKKYKKCCINN